MNNYHTFIGIDIGKNNFVVAIHGQKEALEYANTPEGINQFLENYHPHFKDALCVLETTGGYELSLLYMGMRLAALADAANLPDKLRMLEIGAGYGGLFEKLMRLMGQQVDVVYLVDLPFNLTIQYWFVDACRKAGLHDLELIVNPSPGTKFSRAVVFVPIDDLEVIGELDVAINARSFGEMFPDDVRKYIDLIQSRVQPGGIFYNMNRYEKENAAGDVLRLKDCPVDEKWMVLNSQLVIFFYGVGELVLLRSSEPNPTLRMSLAALPPYMLGDS